MLATPRQRLTLAILTATLLVSGVGQRLCVPGDGAVAVGLATDAFGCAADRRGDEPTSSSQVLLARDVDCTDVLLAPLAGLCVQRKDGTRPLQVPMSVAALPVPDLAASRHASAVPASHPLAVPSDQARSLRATVLRI